MILLQLSSGQGPIESAQAVGLAIKTIEKQCRESGVVLDLVDVTPVENAPNKDCYKSALLILESVNNNAQAKQVAEQIAKQWQGSMLWVCQSLFRPKHKRKNWFFSGHVFDVNEQLLLQADKEQKIDFQTCRASGSGGQHVNTTDSAVRATHKATGMSVRVESERSQHANKRLAAALLFQKLEALKHEQRSAQDKDRWQQHWELERGNPVRTFKGTKFKEI